MKTALPRFCCLLAALVFTVSSVASRAAEVIVHTSVTSRELPVNAIRLYFTMRVVRWPDGGRIKVFVLPDKHPVHRDFAKRTLELYPRQLRRVWDRYRYAGSGPVPVEVLSVEEMIDRVASTPGAIGYVSDGAADERVEVVNVK